MFAVYYICCDKNYTKENILRIDFVPSSSWFLVAIYLVNDDTQLCRPLDRCFRRNVSSKIFVVVFVVVVVVFFESLYFALIRRRLLLSRSFLVYMCLCLFVCVNPRDPFFVFFLFLQ